MLAFELYIVVQREMWQGEAPGFEDPRLCYEAHGWKVVRFSIDVMIMFEVYKSDLLPKRQS